ncbi:electron transfer flavoprotein subunit beta/FixA family protein [Elusimicrobiota bacterium]
MDKKLKVIVCFKVVPRPEEVKVNKETNTLDRANVRNIINPPDMNALELALMLKDKHDAEVTLVSMGPPFFEGYLRLAMSVGADKGYLLSDRAFGGADTLATTYTLAEGIKKAGNYDIIICGEESSDGATAQVPPGLAEWLDTSQVTYVTDLEYIEKDHKIKARREVKGGHEDLISALPAVLSVKPGINELRFINFDRKEWSIKDAQVTVWNAKDIGADEAKIGWNGSPTTVAGVKQLATLERKREKIKGDPKTIAKELAKKLKPSLQ